MILFGWYSFLIKSYLLGDLGISTEGLTEHVQVEVRQKCFHLFYIPFFSIGKMYAIRRGGQLFDLPNDVVQLVRMKDKHQTPWYTYIGLILVTASLLFYWVNEKYSDYQSQKMAAQEEAERKEWVANPTVNDYYKMSNNQYKDYYAKVEIVNKDSVLLKIPLGDDIPYLYSPQSTSRYFRENEFPYTLEWIAKEDIRKSIESSYGDLVPVHFYDIAADSLLVFKEVMRDVKEEKNIGK